MSKNISKDAFKGDNTIESVVFGKECTSIGENAFQGCTSLKGFNDDNNIKNIDDFAFENTKIVEVKIDNLTTLGKCVFYDSNLHSISIPNCEEILDSVFYNCKNLYYIECSNVTSIGNNAFYKCSSLKSINIPYCNTFGYSSFTDCSGLKTVTTDTNEINVDGQAFLNCSSLTDFSFNNCISIGFGAFVNCKSLYNKLNLNKCKTIGYNAFNNCNNITQVNLSICTKIGNNAFINCKKLSKVYINNTSDNFCELLGRDVFKNTSSNIIFYFRPETIESYKNDEYWKYYIDKMMMLPQNNQIIYTTIDDIVIDTSGLTIENNRILRNEIVSNNQILLEFENKIEYLKDKIFMNNEKLTSFDLPSECTHIFESEFENCKNLSSFTSSNTLIQISDNVFKNCESLISFNIPDSLQSLGEGVFAGCKNIRKFEGNKDFVKYNGRAVICDFTLICVVPNDDSETEGRIHNISDIDPNIVRLGKSCFHGCTNVRRIDIPSSINYIGDNAFEGCINLYEIHFEGDVPPTIGTNIFEGIETNFKIFVPEDKIVQYMKALIGYENKIYPKPTDNSIIYYADNKLDSSHTSKDIYGIPNGLYFKISNVLTTPDCFYNQNSVRTVILGDNITKITQNAFKNCSNLEYIYISDNIKELNNNCFYGCESLTRIHIPSNCTFGDEIFVNCTNLTEFGSYRAERVSADNRCYIENTTLKFFASGGLTTYSIPDNITKINKSVFRQSEIENITLNENVTEIGETAFWGCKNLQSIQNWNGVKSILKNAFVNCDNLGEISLPSNLTNIENYAFAGCKKMYINTNIPNSVINIGENAFKNCYAFKYVNKQNNNEDILTLGNITCINKNTFRGCTSLKSVNINNNIKTIDSYAFYGCNNLTSIIISQKDSKLTIINDYAFRDCKSLNTLDLPLNLSYIGSYAFYNCEAYKGYKKFNLKNPPLMLTIPSNVNNMGDYCFANTGIEKISIPTDSKLIHIPNYAFYNCKDLTNISILSQNVTSIGDSTFKNCVKLCTTNNGNLTLSNYITTIGDSTFSGCTGINGVIIIPPNTTTLGHMCFEINQPNAVIDIRNINIIPKFTKYGVLNTDSYPFGSISGKIPKIAIKDNSIKVVLNNSYNSPYWSKYNNRLYIL